MVSDLHLHRLHLLALLLELHVLVVVQLAQLFNPTQRKTGKQLVVYVLLEFLD